MSEEKKNKVTQPSMALLVNIGPNEYKIDFPNNDKLIRIERGKAMLTGGKGQEMIGDLNLAGYDAYIIACAISAFEVLIPQLSTDLNVKSMLELDMRQSKTIIKAYEKYYEWMDEWRKYINSDE